MIYIMTEKKNILAADSSVFINLTGVRINSFSPTKCAKLQLAKGHVQQSRQLFLGEKLAETKIMFSVQELFVNSSTKFPPSILKY